METAYGKTASKRISGLEKMARVHLYPDHPAAQLARAWIAGGDTFALYMGNLGVTVSRQELRSRPEKWEADVENTVFDLLRKALPNYKLERNHEGYRLSQTHEQSRAEMNEDRRAR